MTKSFTYTVHYILFLLKHDAPSAKKKLRLLLKIPQKYFTWVTYEIVYNWKLNFNYVKIIADYVPSSSGIK